MRLAFPVLGGLQLVCGRWRFRTGTYDRRADILATPSVVSAPIRNLRREFGVLAGLRTSKLAPI